MRLRRRRGMISQNLRTAKVAVGDRNNQRSLTIGILELRVSASSKEKLGDVSLRIGWHTELSNEMKRRPPLGICDMNISATIQERLDAFGPPHAASRMEKRSAILQDGVGIDALTGELPYRTGVIVVYCIRKQACLFGDCARRLAAVLEVGNSNSDPAHHCKDHEQKSYMRMKAEASRFASEENPPNQPKRHNHRTCENECHSCHPIPMLRRGALCDKGPLNGKV